MPTHINGRPVKTGQWTDAEDALLAEWQAKLGNRCALWPPRSAAALNLGMAGWEQEGSLFKTFVGRISNVETAWLCRGWAAADTACVEAAPGRRRSFCTQLEIWTRTLCGVWLGACRWSAVAKKVVGRTGQQCAQRWRHKVRLFHAQRSTLIFLHAASTEYIHS